MVNGPRSERTARRAAAVVALALLAACAGSGPAGPAAPERLPEYRGFGAPQAVTLRGYRGDAMEPFISPDGRYLLFNNRNDPRIDTQLHWAERIDDLTFDYRGEIAGANTPALDAVPSLDRDGTLYFISTRSYADTLSTLYRGRFDAGRLSDVALVDGVSLNRPGMLVFDAEISADGTTLFLVDGRFTGGPMPKTADIDIAVREGPRFRRLPAGHALLANVNTAALEYAPVVSGDLRELFFTRLTGSGRKARFQILRAARPDDRSPFGPPEVVAAIAGHVEAPTLSGDGRSLYFHRLDGDRFAIHRVAR
jgi:hypothetical protein